MYFGSNDVIETGVFFAFFSRFRKKVYDKVFAPAFKKMRKKAARMSRVLSLDGNIWVAPEEWQEFADRVDEVLQSDEELRSFSVHLRFA